VSDEQFGSVQDEIVRLLGVPFPRVNYLTHIDDKRRVVYVETPKVACTSIKKFMMDQYVGGSFDLSSPNKVHDRQLSPLRQLSEYSAGDGLDVWGAGYRRFSFVRNPYTRLLSGYLDKLIHNEWERERHLPMMGFEPGSYPTLLEFLERLAQKPDGERDIHFATQSSLLMIGRVEYDFLGRFEEFQSELQKLKVSFYDSRQEAESYEDFGKHHASNASKKIRQYYGSREAELVQSIYHADFENFGYPLDLRDVALRIQPVQIPAST
tara:strand:+ start:4629 stop:5426 length:798 start_codon:yes stop_codon:yes gene_type:complete